MQNLYFQIIFFFLKMAQQATLKLYKSLLSEATKFPDFNFRNYFIRRIKDGFYEGKELKNPEEIQKSLDQAKISLEMLRRQASIGEMFNPNIKVPLSK